MSKAFSIPGIERLCSGVTNNTASAASIAPLPPAAPWPQRLPSSGADAYLDRPTLCGVLRAGKRWHASLRSVRPAGSDHANRGRDAPGMCHQWGFIPLADCAGPSHRPISVRIHVTIAQRSIIGVNSRSVGRRVIWVEVALPRWRLCVRRKFVRVSSIAVGDICGFLVSSVHSFAPRPIERAAYACTRIVAVFTRPPPPSRVQATQQLHTSSSKGRSQSCGASA
jgi:hypothetical protein